MWPYVWVSCALIAAAGLTASRVVGQETPDDTALATLCMVDWSISPIWAGATLGCPPVLRPLPAPNQPCRTRYSTSANTHEEARLRYDGAGRLSEVEHVDHDRTSYVYDAEGRLTARTTRRTAYPAATTSYQYEGGSITEDNGDEYCDRWHVEGGRFVSSDSIHGACDAAPMAVSRWVYEQDLLVGSKRFSVAGPQATARGVSLRVHPAAARSRAIGEGGSAAG